MSIERVGREGVREHIAGLPRILVERGGVVHNNR